MCWFVIIDVLGDATWIRPAIGQGHPTGGTNSWFPPFFLYNVIVLKWFSYGWYGIELSMNVKPTMKYWSSCWRMSNRLWNIDRVVDKCKTDYGILIELPMNVKLTMKCWLSCGRMLNWLWNVDELLIRFG